MITRWPCASAARQRVTDTPVSPPTPPQPRPPASPHTAHRTKVENEVATRQASQRRLAAERRELRIQLVQQLVVVDAEPIKVQIDAAEQHSDVRDESNRRPDVSQLSVDSKLRARQRVSVQQATRVDLSHLFAVKQSVNAACRRAPA